MNTVQYTMYQPTAGEIAHVTASAARRHPQLASRIDKAADILTAGLQLEPVAWEVRNVVHWRIASQSYKGAYIIAVAAYMKVLANRFNADVRARAIDLGILPDGTFNAYAKRLGIVHIRKIGSAYTFADQASAVRYSLWLAAQPVAVGVPVAATVAA